MSITAADARQIQHWAMEPKETHLTRSRMRMILLAVREGHDLDNATSGAVKAINHRLVLVPRDKIATGPDPIVAKIKRKPIRRVKGAKVKP